MRTRIRSARGAILSGLAAYALCQAGFAVLVSRGTLWLRDDTDALKLRLLHDRVHSEGSAFTMVALGSSRTFSGLHGQSLEALVEQEWGQPTVVFNFGRVGAGPIPNLLALRRMLADGVRPDLLLLEVLPYRLGQTVSGDTMPVYMPAHKMRADELSLLRRYTRGRRMEKARDWWIGAFVPSYEHRTALLNATFPALVEAQQRRPLLGFVDQWGWMRHSVGKLSPQQSRALEKTNLDALARHLKGFRFPSGSAEALDDTLAFCSRHNIPAVLVLMPEAAIFQDRYPEPIWRQVIDYVEALSAKHQVPLVNARDWMRPEDFQDPQHLSNEGALAFSERLGREVVLPRLKTMEVAASNGSHE